MIRPDTGICYGAVLFILLIVSGCKKDSATDANPLPGSKKLIKVQEGPTDYTAFEYYPNGLLKKVTTSFMFNNGPQIFHYTISYNNGKIKEVHQSDGNITRYFYDHGKLEKTETTDALGVLLYINTYNYQNDKLVTHGYLASTGPGSILKRIQETRYTYYTNGNIREATLYGRNPATNLLEAFQVHKYELYDNNTNPLKSLGDFGFAFFRYINTRNPVEESLYDRNYVLQETTENSFTYNDAGLPVKNIQKITPAGSQYPTTIDITYTYQ